MSPLPISQDDRLIGLAMHVGVGGAAGYAALVESLDYPVNALAKSTGETAGALFGLVAVLAVPPVVASRYRLVGPLLAAVVSAGWPVYREFTTAPPFSTLGGFAAVDGPQYVDAYVDGWYVWLFASLLLGLV